MTKLEKLCIRWLNENFNNMELFYMEEYPNYVFHMKDGKCVLQHNIKNGYVYVNYREIWRFFESFFSMTNQEIKDITKIWVEEHYKMNEITTDRKNKISSSLVEEHYKMEVTTTNDLPSLMTFEVEEQFREIQITNNQNHFYFNRDVEKLYEEHQNG